MLFKKRFGSGALNDVPDIRDFKYEEIASAPNVQWVEKSTFRSFPIFDQAQSSSCVAQAVSKVLGIENYLEEGKFVSLSARDIYTRRSNFAQEGMYFRDAMEIGNKYGATIEQLMPSQKLDEVFMNLSNDRTFTSEYTAKIFKGGSYISVPADIDSVASVISMGKGILLGFRWDYNEWDKEYPIISDNSKQSYGHAVVGVDYALINGKKYIIIDDSWGYNRGRNGQRFVSEDWFTKRCVAAWYFENLVNSESVSGEIENYIFNNDLSYGMKNDEVMLLQKKLQRLGFFPTGQECTGYFGGITRQAVKEFQIKYGIEPTEGYFGIKTRSVLNGL
jgi:hypothetical protein